MGLPGAWTVLLLRAVVVHPAGSGFPSPYWRGNRRGLQAKRHPQHPGRHNFRGCFPTAHTLACLRVARRVAAAGARPTTGWAGSPFAGRGSHPLDDEPNFTRSSHLTPFGPASPGRTGLLILARRRGREVAQGDGRHDEPLQDGSRLPRCPRRVGQCAQGAGRRRVTVWATRQPTDQRSSTRASAHSPLPSD